MGHTSGLKAIYARFDQAVDILREGYLKAETNLSIFGSSSKIIELKEKVQEKEEDIDELVKNLSVMRVRLENKIGEQEVVVEELKQTNQMLLETILSQGSRMDELEKEVQSLSEKKYAEYWDEYIERVPDIQALSR
jgi:predicted nuclease with TOPRIM domain